MSVSERVRQALATNAPEQEAKADFAKLRDFYEQAKQAGIVQQQSYTIPPLDTVGHRLYQMTTKQSR